MNTIKATSEELSKMYLGGFTLWEIAAEYGANPSSIRKRLLKHGTAMRPHTHRKKEGPKLIPYYDRRPGLRQRHTRRQTAKIKERRTVWIKQNGPCKMCGSLESPEIDHVIPSLKHPDLKSLRVHAFGDFCLARGKAIGGVGEVPSSLQDLSSQEND